MYQSAGTDGVVDDAVALVVALDVSAAAVVDIACVGADAASVVVAAAQPAGSEVPLAVATGADVDTDEDDDTVDDTFDDLASVEPERVSRDRYATMSLPTATTLTTSQPSAAFEVSDVANAA